MADFVSVVLADTEDTWSKIFSASGSRYQTPRLVLFTDSVQSACGYNTAATGPFYCPPDKKIYIDLGFFNELNRMGADIKMDDATALINGVEQLSGAHVMASDLRASATCMNLDGKTVSVTTLVPGVVA